MFYLTAFRRQCEPRTVSLLIVRKFFFNLRPVSKSETALCL